MIMKIARSLLVFFIFLPVSVFATSDIVLINHTNFFGSAYVTFSPCSSSAGKEGILTPHGQLVVPNHVLRMFCTVFSCDIHAYMSKDCSGKEVATITVSPSKGVQRVHVHDHRFRFINTRHHITIDQISAKYYF